MYHDAIAMPDCSLSVPDDPVTLGGLIGDFVKTEMRSWRDESVFKIGFLAEGLRPGLIINTAVRCMHSIRDSFGEAETHEIYRAGSNLEHSLTQTESVGWVRMFDAMETPSRDRSWALEACEDPDFWEGKAGVDLCNCCDCCFFTREIEDFDLIIQIIETEEDKIAKLFSDPKLEDNPRYKELLEQVQTQFKISDKLMQRLEKSTPEQALKHIVPGMH